MNKEEIIKLLDKKKIQYELVNHEAVFNMDELKNISLPYPSLEAKNLFIRDDKKKKYYLISLKGNKKIDLKEFRNKINSRPLSFASVDDLYNILKLMPGFLTPFGLLNDETNKVEFYLDEYFLNNPGIIGIHPNENTASIFLKVKDLISILEEKGNITHIIKI